MSFFDHIYLQTVVAFCVGAGVGVAGVGGWVGADLDLQCVHVNF